MLDTIFDNVERHVEGMMFAMPKLTEEQVSKVKDELQKHIDSIEGLPKYNYIMYIGRFTTSSWAERKYSGYVFGNKKFSDGEYTKTPCIISVKKKFVLDNIGIATDENNDIVLVVGSVLSLKGVR